MRLTLRTLLAWKDGVLPDTESRALGDKVASSPVAGPLLARIDEVVSRPQLGAVRPDSRGLGGDPLSVARYLDNTLPDDQLEPFERICLESDLHLAEVASCHRILAEIEREATGLPPLDSASRGRLLGALAQSMPGRPSTTSPVVTGEESRNAPRLGTARSTRKRVPWWAIGTAAIAVLTVAALAGVLVTTLSERRGGGGERRRGAPDALAAADPLPVADVVAPGPDAAPSPPNGAATSETPPPPSAAPEPPGAPAESPAMAVVVNVPVAPGGEGAMEPAPGSEPAEARPASMSVSGRGPVLWRAAGGKGEWTAALPGSEFAAGTDLVVPPGAEPAVSVLGVTFRPRPGSRCVITVDAAANPRLEVLFGGCVASADRPDAVLRVAAAGLETIVGGALAAGVDIDVTRRLPVGVDPATAVATVGGRLTALGDGIELRIAAGGEGTPLEAGRTLAWDGADPGAATVVAAPSSSGAEHAARERLERHAAAALEARIEAGDGLTAALEVLAGSRRVEQRALAATTGALLGRFDDLVDLLVADRPPQMLRDGLWEEVFAAAVPLALARGANAAAALRQAVETRGPPGRGDVLWGLVSGFDPATGSAPAGTALVDLLDDESLVVRRVAYLRLCQVTGPTATDRARYRPDSPPERRRDGIDWWRRQVERRRVGAGPRD